MVDLLLIRVRYHVVSVDLSNQFTTSISDDLNTPVCKMLRYPVSTIKAGCGAFLFAMMKNINLCKVNIMALAMERPQALSDSFFLRRSGKLYTLHDALYPGPPILPFPVRAEALDHKQFPLTRWK